MNRVHLFSIVFAFTLSCAAIVAQNPDDVILTIDGEKVTAGEFERVYTKNSSVTGPEVEDKGIEEYMEMYLNFKLKVREAMEQGLDTDPAFQKELEQYVSQLEKPYLNDDEYIDELIEEAYERMQNDLRASHIMIAIDEDAAPADTLEAYSRAFRVYKKLKAGADFEKTAREESDDPSAERNAGDLGWFSAFRMVYPFESAAYNTPPGEISAPVRTRFGYHIIKVTDKRPAMPKMKVAHIMVKVDENASPEEQTTAEEKIEELYQKVQKDEDFSAVARRYSDDKASARNGGMLPEFTTGRMVPDFENAVYDLKEKGEVTEPFRTPFGWHIAKLYDRVPHGSFEEERENIKRKVERDNRAGDSRKRLASKLGEEYGLKIYGKNVDALASHLDSAYFAGDRENSGLRDINSKKILKWKDREYGKQKVTVTQGDFAKYLLDIETKKQHDPQKFLCESFEDFKTDKIIDYERSILDVKYPEYKALKTEYRDGILLFNLMEKEVWRKANEDTTGLEAFYNKNKEKYMWPLRVEAVIYTAEDKAAAERALTMTADGKSDSTIYSKLNEESSLGVVIKRETADPENHKILSRVKAEEGNAELVKYDGEYYVVKIEKVLQPRPKSIEEARGLITSDYQDYLEHNWIRDLREKYDYEVNEQVLEQLAEKYN